jgi:hypothetical protein
VDETVDGNVDSQSTPAPLAWAVWNLFRQPTTPTYKEALHHQRGGADENDDALTAACAAVEAAMKAAGYRGDRLGSLSKSFRNSGAVPPELAGVPEALDTLLHRIDAIRSSHGDSHGKHAGADEVPQALVDLAIHWADAFIVYLAAEHA